MIPECWANENENYITNPVLAEFCTNNGIKTQYTRMDLLNAINEYAQENDENKAKVEDWLEVVLKQGMKNILFRKIEFETKPDDDILRKSFTECKNRKLYSNITEGNSLNLQSMKIRNNKIEFVFTIFIIEEKKDVKSRIVYPIFIDIDLNKKLIFGRAKSKTNIHTVSSENIDEIGLNT